MDLAAELSETRDTAWTSFGGATSALLPQWLQMKMKSFNSRRSHCCFQMIEYGRIRKGVG
jgi:hypothetical protein